MFVSLSETTFIWLLDLLFSSSRFIILFSLLFSILSFLFYILAESFHFVISLSIEFPTSSIRILIFKSSFLFSPCSFNSILLLFNECTHCVASYSPEDVQGIPFLRILLLLLFVSYKLHFLLDLFIASPIPIGPCLSIHT